MYRFGHIGNSGEFIEGAFKVESFSIDEREGRAPQAVIRLLIPPCAPRDIERNDVSLRFGEDTLFTGYIDKVVEISSNEIDIFINNSREDNPTEHADSEYFVCHFFENRDPDALRLMNKKIMHYDRSSNKTFPISLIKTDVAPIDVTKSILSNSLKVTKKNDNYDEIDLEIHASWGDKIDKIIDITNKISHKFDGNKINTLTPDSLIETWPKYGDRIYGTKYFFGPSRIKLDSSIRSADHTPKITIANLQKDIALKKYWFNHKLTIGIEYEQIRKEIVKVKIKNFQQLPTNKHSKKLLFNLNVHDFMEEQSRAVTFFDLPQGREAIEYAMDIVGGFLLLSMRSHIIQFELPFKREFLNLNTSNWIKLNQIIAKITSVEIAKSFDRQKIKITAESFCERKQSDILGLKEYSKTGNGVFFKHEDINVDENAEEHDVIKDIVVRNQTHEQFDKIVEALKNAEKTNYKTIIQNCLNKNKTTIEIVTNELKVERCKTSEINLSDAYFIA